MKAIVCRGGALLWDDVPMPECHIGEVLIRVSAAGVSRPDILQRAGLYRPPHDASAILGLEVAGHVVSGDLTGSGFAVGDAVCALVHGGGYAQYVTVNAAHCLPMPTGWSMLEAASLPETFFTVWFNVFDKAALGAGRDEILLVHAGASGIGVAAIQMACALGQTVYATASSATKRQACLDFGASQVFASDDLMGAVDDLGGVDVVLDMLAGDTCANNIKVLKHGGRLVWIAYLSGRQVNLNVQDVMAKELQLTGSFLRRQSNAVKAKIAFDLRQQVWPHLESGLIRPVVDSVYAIQHVADAHERMQKKSNIGKIVLQLQPC